MTKIHIYKFFSYRKDIIMLVNLNFMVEKGSQLAKSSILKPAQHLNNQEIKYAPKQFKANIAKTAFPRLHENINEIATMRKAGVTQNEIAERFGVVRTTVQRFLKTHLAGVIPENKEFLNAVKTYFSAKTLEEKNIAFQAVDPFLQKMAKEKFKMQKNCSYDDCLQDLRLNFVNVTNKNKENPNFKISQFLYEFKRNAFKPTVSPEKPIRIQLSELEKDGSPIAEMDLGINAFEENDYKSKQILNSGLSDRERMIVNSLTSKNKSVDEIGTILGLAKIYIEMIIFRIDSKLGSFKDLPRKPKPLQ